MSVSSNAMLHEQVRMVVGFSPLLPSASTPDYVSMKNYDRCSIVFLVNNATTVTGSAITVKQATTVAGGSEKAVAFTTAYRNLTAGAGTSDTLASFDVSSNTFTTDSTNNVDAIYVIDIRASQLDVAGGFDCIRAGIGDATAAVIGVLYLLYGQRYSTPGSAVID